MSVAMNEEAQKKNTDCVYFLASPLTCKKGNDCEFRHSESARNNPRDCWYWLSGSCLNTNCAFRHPPLEAISEGEQAAGGRLRVPCYYFMQGYCVKGDKCNFMHGLPTAPVTDASQKASKPVAPKTEVSESQTSANKGNGSATSKGSVEVHEAVVEVHSQKADKVVKAVHLPVINKLPECSDSSAPPTRSRLLEPSNLSDRSKQVSAANGRLSQMHSPDEKLLPRETRAEDELLCGYQPGDDGLGQDPSGEDQLQEGTESEEMWEESSFDVLVDDGGTDQLIYADELDYLNPYDALVEQLTGGGDGFVDFDYDHVAAYQYYDAEYEVATYDAYEKQLLYGQLGSFEPEDSMQPVVEFKKRLGKDMLPRVRRDVTFDKEARPQRLNVSSNDLRNHIVKRRRAEKNQKYGDDHNRRRQQDNGPQHNRRHQGEYFKQQEGQARRHMSPRSGTRSNRQYAGRGDPFGGRQFYGRSELPAAKRPFRDLASDHEEIDAERGSGKNFRGMNDTLKSKVRKEQGQPAIAGIDEALGNRGYPQIKKVEFRKDGSSFTGPKSLAQIKAEKLKALQEQGLAGQHCDGSECNGTEELHRSPASQIKSKVSHRFYKETESKDTANPAKGMMLMDADFEGPKPLSVILRQKRRVGREGNIMVSDEKHTETEDASVEAKTVPSQIRRVSEERKAQLHKGANSVAFPTHRRAFHAAGMHSSKLDRAADPALDMETGLDVGDNVMEDVDFEDDDEDDFAKKLGGFLS